MCSELSELVRGQGDTRPSQCLSDQLTLFQTGWLDYAHHIARCPPPPDFWPSYVPGLSKALSIVDVSHIKVQSFGISGNKNRLLQNDYMHGWLFSNFSCMFLNPNIFFNLNSNCYNSLDKRNLQEQDKKASCYQKLFWPFTIWINCSSDFKIFANFWPSASNFKSFSQSLEQFLSSPIACGKLK